MFKKITGAALAAFMSSLFFVIGVHAETISLSVEGNGDGSSNEVSQTTENNTQVTQSNEANVTNNVTTDVNTGNNTASENTGGESNISTGNAAQDITVANTNVNTNNTQVNNCCNSSTSQSISGNGSESNNSINNTNTTNNTILQINHANLQNNIYSNLNTGNNYASGNGGKVTINTGNIKSDVNVINNGINLSLAKIMAGTGKNIAEIKGNGADSVNSITFKNIFGIDVIVYNTANISNDVNHNANTGDNVAKDNNGDVEIGTGDVTITTSILNENINGSVVEVDCKCKEKPEKPVTPTPQPQPQPTPSNGNGGGNGGGKGGPGEVLGATTGDVLPVTGTPWVTFMTIFAIGLFLMGLFLRYRTGISPPVVA